MAHRIIISNRVSNAAELAGISAEHLSLADYQFTFEPSHHLSEQIQNKRIAKIRKVLDKLANEVTAENEPAEPV